MTLKNRSTMERVIGILDGVSFVASGGISDAIACASEMLEDVLKSESADASGAIVPPVAVGGVVYYPMIFDPSEGTENCVFEEKVCGIGLLEDGSWQVGLPAG